MSCKNACSCKNYKYMHTINGQPGYFEINQIVYAVKTRPVKLCDTLEQIKEEQTKTLKFRKAMELENHSNFDYIKIKV